MFSRCAQTTVRPATVQNSQASQSPQKKYSAKNGQAAAAAMEPMDTRFVVATSTMKMSSSRQAPIQPNVTNRQPTATAMPLPPLKPSHGQKICPHTQPRNATASMVSYVTSAPGSKPPPGRNHELNAQARTPDSRPLPKSRTNTA